MYLIITAVIHSVIPSEQKSFRILYDGWLEHSHFSENYRGLFVSTIRTFSTGHCYYEIKRNLEREFRNNWPSIDLV